MRRMIHTTTIGQEISMAEHFKPKSIYAQDVEKKTNGSERFMAPVRTGSPTRVTRDTSVNKFPSFPCHRTGVVTVAWTWKCLRAYSLRREGTPQHHCKRAGNKLCVSMGSVYLSFGDRSRPLTLGEIR